MKFNHASTRGVGKGTNMSPEFPVGEKLKAMRRTHGRRFRGVAKRCLGHLGGSLSNTLRLFVVPAALVFGAVLVQYNLQLAF